MNWSVWSPCLVLKSLFPCPPPLAITILEFFFLLFHKDPRIFGIECVIKMSLLEARTQEPVRSLHFDQLWVITLSCLSSVRSSTTVFNNNKRVWWEIIFSVPPLKTVLKVFVKGSRRGSKIFWQELQRCCPRSLKPQDWLIPPTNLALSPPPHVYLPWSLLFTGSTWSHSFTSFQNYKVPLSYLWELAARHMQWLLLSSSWPYVEVAARDKGRAIFVLYMSTAAIFPDTSQCWRDYI